MSNKWTNSLGLVSYQTVQDFGEAVLKAQEKIEKNPSLNLRDLLISRTSPTSVKGPKTSDPKRQAEMDQNIEGLVHTMMYDKLKTSTTDGGANSHEALRRTKAGEAIHMFLANVQLINQTGGGVDSPVEEVRDQRS